MTTRYKVTKEKKTVWHQAFLRRDRAIPPGDIYLVSDELLYAYSLRLGSR